MAQRRMYSKDVVRTDKFLDMPLSAQALYFHLGMEADDDGFVSAPKQTTRMIGAREDDLRLLIGKGYIIPFETGVCVVTHWKMNNYLRADRYKATIHREEVQSLQTDEIGAYSVLPGQFACLPVGIPNDNQVGDERYTQDRIGKDSIEKDNINILGAHNAHADKPHTQKRFIPPTLEEVKAYIQERGSNVNAQGFIDFYESKGWMVGKSKMKDWKAACRRAEKWESNRRTDIRNPKNYEYMGGSL